VIQQWDGGGLEAHDYLSLGPLLLQTLTAQSGFVPPPPAISIAGFASRRQMPREYLPPEIAPERPQPPVPADEIPIVEVAPDPTSTTPVLAQAIARDLARPRITTRPILHLPPALKRKQVDTDPVLDDDDELLMLM
jgi:hypothetical protein